jgi:hypothetical protein
VRRSEIEIEMGRRWFYQHGNRGRNVHTKIRTTANGPNLLSYVENGIVQTNEEFQWHISNRTNCNGTSLKRENYNGMKPNNQKNKLLLISTL